MARLFLNSVTIAGNLTEDPKFTDLGVGDSGKPNSVCNARLALNRSFGAGENRKEVTTYIDVTAWARTAEYLRNCAKGDNLYVEGSLDNENWEDKDGRKCSKVKITARSIQVPVRKSEQKSVEHSAENPLRETV